MFPRPGHSVARCPTSLSSRSRLNRLTQNSDALNSFDKYRVAVSILGKNPKFWKILPSVSIIIDQHNYTHTSLYLHCIFTVSSLYLHCIFTVSSLYLHCIFTVSSFSTTYYHRAFSERPHLLHAHSGAVLGPGVSLGGDGVVFWMEVGDFHAQLRWGG